MILNKYHKQAAANLDELKSFFIIMASKKVWSLEILLSVQKISSKIIRNCLKKVFEIFCFKLEIYEFFERISIGLSQAIHPEIIFCLFNLSNKNTSFVTCRTPLTHILILVIYYQLDSGELSYI